MENKPLYEILFERFNREFDVFEPTSKKFFSVLANPGSGKTYNLIKTLEFFYGSYVTKNEFQKYITSSGEELIIPAGYGNLAKEDGETFKLKTNNGNDVFFENTDKRTAIIAYNSDIKKEFEKKVKNSSVLKNNKEFISVRTSHSLLFKLAEKMGLFPKKNELGEYEIDGKKINFAKGSFTITDMKKILNAMSQKKKYSFLTSLDNKEKLKLSKILLELINSYYQTDIVINKIPEDIIKLYNLSNDALKEIEEDAISYINSFNKEGGLFYVEFLISAVQHMKKLINTGYIELCHDYYYKEVFIECMRNKNRLLQLFSIDNNPEKYFNIIMVDEAQDLTPIMSRLLIEFYKYIKHKNLDVVFTIVGDRKQAIYSFANRVDAFEIIEKNLGSKNVEYFTLNKSYRMSPSVCNFTNNVCKKLDIYKKEEKIIPAYEEKHGMVFDENYDLKDLAKFCIDENEGLMVLGRTNAEILTEYIAVYNEIKNYNPSFLKYLKIDSKLKKSFKELLKKGIKAIEDNNLIDKIKILTGKENFTIEDLKRDEVFEKLPLYLQKFIELKENYSDELIEEALNNRASPKSIVKFMTLHSAKGLEEENIFILDGILESLDLKSNNDFKIFANNLKNILNKNSKENIEPEDLVNDKKELMKKMEKFLYYVGITRAKRNLFLDEKLFDTFKDCIENVNHLDIKDKFSKKISKKKVVNNKIKK